MWGGCLALTIPFCKTTPEVKIPKIKIRFLHFPSTTLLKTSNPDGYGFSICKEKTGREIIVPTIPNSKEAQLRVYEAFLAYIEHTPEVKKLYGYICNSRLPSGKIISGVCVSSQKCVQSLEWWQNKLAQIQNDPNLTITTQHVFQLDSEKEV